jgi:hypothetical protein
MFRISAITRVGLVAVACAAVAAPSALAKPPVKSLYGYAMSYTPTKAAKVQSVHYGYAMSYKPTKATTKKAAKVQSVKKAASSSNDNLRAGLSNAYTQGCQNGTVSDRTMGGDNNNYEYYGDVCTVSVPADPAPSVLGASGQTVTPAAGHTFFMFDNNTNYEYYGSPSGS